MIDWNKIIEHAIAEAPLIIGAVAAAIYKLRKIEKRQMRIEEKVNGNHQQQMRAIKAQGRLEGVQLGRELVKKDLADVAKVTRRSRGKRSTDK